ncbi:hypothetical protein BBBOND_0110520 [Babesia bigemina]|uniref:Uncharacterized protein n=1 Tax=Babesia bigemina TaxID=5866 RepID=A0A061D762_BABBI|nr:hypothetical protein BBBOND_0110520 [Babesia bigemina]CDR94754.1 hypothetical protein BBBOND_0110520 [Babesia bigemina]|eukprot:XP_012766940.1 hypothetical protein BBBOND_0110520 [Babesia bigemina]
MAYNSLTQVPRNLKEAVDWLMALKGTTPDANLTAMGVALHDFLAEMPVGLKRLQALEKIKSITRKFLRNPELSIQPFVFDLLRRFNGPMNKTYRGLRGNVMIVNDSDYKNFIQTDRLQPHDIANGLGTLVHGCEHMLANITDPEEYKSSYTSEASWAGSCQADPEACAVVFVGIAPMLYAGLRSLRAVGNVATQNASMPDADDRIEDVMEALGYVAPERRGEMTGPEVRKAMRSLPVHTLDLVYDLAGFWAFY